MELKKLDVKELYGVALNELRNGDSSVAIKELKKEFDRRRLPMPLTLYPAPKLIILKMVDVPKKSSKIEIPPNIDTRKLMSFYHNHPNKGIIVSMSSDLDWKDLYVGATVYVNVDRPAVGLYKEGDIEYYVTTHNSLIGIV